MAERCLRSRLEIGARRMPLYFFDLLSAEGLAPDEEGTELSSLDEIQNEAAYALADMLRDEVRATNGNPRARDLMIVATKMVRSWRRSTLFRSRASSRHAYLFLRQ